MSREKFPNLNRTNWNKSPQLKNQALAVLSVQLHAICTGQKPVSVKVSIYVWLFLFLFWLIHTAHCVLDMQATHSDYLLGPLSIVEGTLFCIFRTLGLQGNSCVHILKLYIVGYILHCWPYFLTTPLLYSTVFLIATWIFKNRFN